MERVSTYMESIAPESASQNRIETAVTGKDEFIRLAIDVLLAEGYLVPGHGRGKSVTHAKTFTNSSSSQLVPNSSQDELPTSSLVPGYKAGTRTDENSKEDDIPF
jgi:hypothetical protein